MEEIEIKKSRMLIRCVKTFFLIDCNFEILEFYTMLSVGSGGDFYVGRFFTFGLVFLFLIFHYLSYRCGGLENRISKLSPIYWGAVMGLIISFTILLRPMNPVDFIILDFSAILFILMNGKSISANRIFSMKDQESFSHISVDFNPIHTDPEVARRLLFGEVVVHGVHSLLWAIDCILSKFPNLVMREIDALFLKPIFLNQKIKLYCKPNNSGNIRAIISLKNEELSIFKFSFDSLQESENSNNTIPNSSPLTKICKNMSANDISNSEGIIDLFLSKNSEKLFPNICKHSIPSKLAILLATSRLVGMECPGLNSLFTRLKVSFSQSQKGQSFVYNVQKYNKRFGLLQMHLESDDFTGKIETFLRPPISKPPDMDLIQELVNPEEFKDKYVLIVGGSRGLGEIAAKTIAAGGGKTFLTYNQGIGDIKRVVNEIKKRGHETKYCKFDILDNDYKLPDEKITEIYYFASPRIRSGKSEEFDKSLFEYYNSYFCDNARFLFVRVRKKYEGFLRFIYPSTIFIDEKPKEFAEYIKAKEEGELMAKELNVDLPNIEINCPRLPRLNTDQNQSLTPVESENPIPVIISIIRDSSNFPPTSF